MLELGLNSKTLFPSPYACILSPAHTRTISCTWETLWCCCADNKEKLGRILKCIENIDLKCKKECVRSFMYVRCACCMAGWLAGDIKLNCLRFWLKINHTKATHFSSIFSLVHNIYICIHLMCWTIYDRFTYNLDHGVNFRTVIKMIDYEWNTQNYVFFLS